MSIWKSKIGITVPVETLLKEKENTNRPSVARSAGTVGKWGVTSFTSIRRLSSYNQYSPGPESGNCSPQSGDFQLSPGTVSTPDPPKPRKFFKSRSTAPENLLRAFPPIIKSPEPNLGTTHHQNSLSINDYERPISKTKSPKNHKVEKKDKPIKAAKKKKEKPPTKVIIPKEKSSKEDSDSVQHKIRLNDLNKRTSSRTRNKVVNYNEDDEDSKYSLIDKVSNSSKSSGKNKLNDDVEEQNEELVEEEQDDNLAVPNEEDVLESEDQSKGKKQETEKLFDNQSFSTDDEIQTTQPILTPAAVKEIPPSPLAKTVNVDHPPIVLRISKGTSRLVSTDSEDLAFSPTHQSISNNITPGTSNENNTVLSSAELLAVLSDEVEPTQIESQPPVATIDEPKRESIKIKIKTKGVLDKSNKSEKHKKHHHKKKENKVKDDFSVATETNNLESDTKEKQSEETPTSVSTGTRVTRSTRRNQVKETSTNFDPVTSIDTENLNSEKINKINLPNVDRCASPLPGSENYDLYRTLALSDDKEFDSQSSVLGSISSKETAFPTGIAEDSRVIHSRGSSDLATSDIDTSQSSVLVAPPSEINGPCETLESELDDRDECETNKLDEKLQLNDQRNILVDDSQAETIENLEKEVANCISPPPEPINKRVTRRAMKSPQAEVLKPSILGKRTTRNNNNINQTSLVKEELKPVTRRAVQSYSRKRKVQPSAETEILNETSMNSTNDIMIGTPTLKYSDIPDNYYSTSVQNENPNLQVNNWSPDENKSNDHTTKPEYKIKNKFKKTYYEQNIHSDDINSTDIVNKNEENNENNLLIENNRSNENEKPSVKLVISKKKGTFFKSRALVGDPDKKRHVYKHKWDDDTKDKSITNENVKVSAEYDNFDDDDDGESSVAMLRVTRQRNNNVIDEIQSESIKNDTVKTKSFVTVRNVKKAHQIQEIGEYQEMDDDVEYLLDALQLHNPISTRCLSAIQLAQKCMAPAFRMHVRAHGTVTKFFNALQDATKDQSLGLCTATVMFVLSQDNLNMDLDRDSLELMLNLLESDVSHKNVLDGYKSNTQPIQKHMQKVRELCEEIKSQGKAVHLNLDNITVGTLAMETLLSLTSKRAGEWFKEELRELGGLEHIIKSICECCRQISDYVVDWTNNLLEKLRKIERCLRVLENVTQMNEQNQTYILSFNNGNAIDTLVKLYKLCDSEIVLYPTNQSTPKESPGVVIREALVPTLKVLINLTHPFNEKTMGSVIIGEKTGIFDTSLHVLLEAHNYIPEQCVFELSILVLLFLINLTTHTRANRKIIMETHAPTDFGNKFVKIPAIKALVEYFHKCDLMAKQVEQKTDDILDNSSKPDIKASSQEEYQETITKILVQKAGNHMEHSMLASYVSILIGNLVVDSEDNENRIRTYFPDNSFKDMISVLDKYYTFMNLTANSEAVLIAHIKSTKKLIEDLKERDVKHSKSK